MAQDESKSEENQGSGLKLQTSTFILTITAVILICVVAVVKFSKPNTSRVSLSTSPTSAIQNTPVNRDSQVAESTTITNVTPNIATPSATPTSSPIPNTSPTASNLNTLTRGNQNNRQSGRTYAVVIMENANLRKSPTVESDSIREVRYGERFKLVGDSRLGPWFKVFDPNSKSVGWLHGNTIKIE